MSDLTELDVMDYPPYCGCADKQDCPCGNPIVRNGESVKAHWHGVICEDCEAAIIQRFNDRPRGIEALFAGFVPGVPTLAEVKRIEPEANMVLDHDAEMLPLKRGDYVRQWSTTLGYKSIYVFHVVRASLLPEKPSVESSSFGEPEG